MELNHETLSAMRTSFNLKFKQAVEGAETIYRDLADIEGDPKLANVRALVVTLLIVLGPYLRELL